MPVLRKKRGGSSHVPIRAKRSTLNSQTPPLSRNETVDGRLNRLLGRDEAIRPRDGSQSRPLRQRPLNRKTLSDRPAPLAIPQRAADRPEQPIERGEQDGEAGPEENDARIDDEPLHREVEETGAGVTTTRKPVPGPHATRVVERPRKRDAIAERHFQSNLSCWTYWYVTGLCRTVLYDVNTVLLQCAPNLFNLLLIHTTNANATVNITITFLNNFEIKCDTVQAKNYLPAQ